MQQTKSKLNSGECVCVSVWEEGGAETTEPPCIHVKILQLLLNKKTLIYLRLVIVICAQYCADVIYITCLVIMLSYYAG